MLLLSLVPSVLAQSADRPDLPFRSVAGEDGAHVLYSNAALMNFDRDPMYSAWFQTSALQGGNSAIAAATTGNGVGAGIAFREYGPEKLGWWSFSSSASLRLTDTVAFGSAIHWQLPEGGDNNFVSWDLGLGWRPVSWIGFGGTVHNLGSPAPDLGVYTRYDGGLALRPWSDTLTIGLDWIAEVPPDALANLAAAANLTVHPLRGMWLRAWSEVPVAGEAQLRAGGAVELRFADLGAGVTNATTVGGDVGVGAYLTTIPKRDQLFLPGREVAVFELDEPYPYQPTSGLFQAPQESYLSLLRRMRDAAHDPEVRGLLLEVGDAGFSFAQIEEVRGIVRDARAQGKPVVAYLADQGGNGAYLLASACDKVFLHPAGQLDLVGLGAELQFYKGALDLVGVEAQYAKRAEYKSAPEQWTNTASSDPAREELNALLDDLSGTLAEGIAVGRGKTVEEVEKLIDQGPFTGADALSAGLIDGLAYRDELEGALSDTFPRNFDPVFSYGRSPDTSGWEPQRAVAIVTVDGAIVTGESSSGGLLGGAGTGSETVVRALDQARHTPAVRAVVLRVDSPGGSSFASDEIWRAVERLKREGKPVIVSMGGYAASGGYYVSAGATAIYALPSTVTGSIGVYSGKINLAGLYERLNIEVERYDRGRNASMYSSSTPMDTMQASHMDRLVEDTYRQFKEKVQQGRNLSAEEVERVARGRVWSGERAAEQGLVDAFGGLFDAVDRARMEAGMSLDSPYTLVTYDPWGGGGGELPVQIVQAALGPKVRVPEELRPMLSLAALRGEHIFALMPYRLEIK